MALKFNVVKPLQSMTKYAGMRCTLSPILTVVSEVPLKGLSE